MSSIHIRPYQHTDREAVLHLCRLNTPAFFHPDELKDLEAYLDKDADHYFILEQDGATAGCGGYNFTDRNHVIRISWDLLAPHAQGKGLGSLLLKHRMQELEPYRPKAMLMVRTSQLAYRFYEKSGFILKEIVKDYWAPGFDLYLMIHPAFRADTGENEMLTY